MIYLDYHAATPLASAAAAAMHEVQDIAWANPASVHTAGRAARAALERARHQVAQSVGADSAEVVFTSGGTEACWMGVTGLPATSIVMGPTEHPAIEVAAQNTHAQVVALETAADLDLVSEHAQPGALVVTQWVNHETGAIHEQLKGMGEVCRAKGAHLVVDATQALGRVPIDFRTLGADAIAIASHKAGGPSGAGALIVGRGVPFKPSQIGGGQERGRRGGTPSVSSLVGFGAACAGLSERISTMPTVAAWRDRLEAEVVLRGGVVNGGEGARVASATNLSVPGWRSSVLVAALDVEGVMISAGAACSSGVDTPSPVVSALYPNEPTRATSAIRISLGPERLDDGQIDRAVAVIGQVLARS